MKADHRHELKTNELADWLAHLPEWAKENRNSLLAAAAVIVVAIGVYVWVFYSRNVLSVREQVRLTSLVTQVPQQINSVVRAAMQNQDESYNLVPVAERLGELAQETADDDMAALALIERAEALRAELHFRLAEVSREELTRQINEAEQSYRDALNRTPSPALAAVAQFGIGLCEEELGNFDKATEAYRDVVENEGYDGTAAQAAAAYRLQIMDDYKTAVTFAPPPPTPQTSPDAESPFQVMPGDGNAPMVVPMPSDANFAPTAPTAPTTEQPQETAEPQETGDSPTAVEPVEPAAPAETNTPGEG
jgi:tetratricopeptide (TPR) repeat protein